MHGVTEGQRVDGRKVDERNMDGSCEKRGLPVVSLLPSGSDFGKYIIYEPGDNQSSALVWVMPWSERWLQPSVGSELV